MIERAELPVQETAHCKALGHGTTHAAGSRMRLAGAACGTQHDFRARRALRLAAAVAVVGALASGEERLPGNARWIVDPGFFRLGVAAGWSALARSPCRRPCQPPVDLVQLGLVLHLNAEMIETRLAAARRDREIHARIVQHPLRVVGLSYRRLRREQRRIEADGLVEIIDGDVNMQAFHGGRLDLF